MGVEIWLAALLVECITNNYSWLGYICKPDSFKTVIVCVCIYNVRNNGWHKALFNKHF